MKTSRRTARIALVTFGLAAAGTYPLASCAAGVGGDTAGGDGGAAVDSTAPPLDAGQDRADVAAPPGTDASLAPDAADASVNGPDATDGSDAGIPDAAPSPDAADAASPPDASAARDAAIPADFLVGEWLCAGNTSDTSGANNNGTNHSVTFGVDRHGNAGSACSFDGATSYVEVPSSASLNVISAWSLSAWVQPSSFGVLAGIASKYHVDNADGVTVRLSYTAPFSGIDVNEAANVADAATGLLATGAWTHVGVTVNGTAVLCYVNGALAYAGTAGYATKSNTDSFDIGLDYTNRFFAGSIDDVRLYARVLSAAEIDALYLAP